MSATHEEQDHPPPGDEEQVETEIKNALDQQLDEAPLERMKRRLKAATQAGDKTKPTRSEE